MTTPQTPAEQNATLVLFNLSPGDRKAIYTWHKAQQAALLRELLAHKEVTYDFQGKRIGFEAIPASIIEDKLCKLEEE